MYRNSRTWIDDSTAEWWNNSQSPWVEKEICISDGAISSATFFINYTNKPNQESESEMKRGLFEAYIVDPETDTIAWSAELPFVAKDEANARLKAVQKAGDAIAKDVDDYDIIVVRLGDVRAKKEVQEVRISER